VSDELGLTKALPVPGGGTLDYVLEEVWVDGQAERTFILRSPTFLDTGDLRKL
jgi:hypothetical protein